MFFLKDNAFIVGGVLGGGGVNHTETVHQYIDPLFGCSILQKQDFELPSSYLLEAAQKYTDQKRMQLVQYQQQ